MKHSTKARTNALVLFALPGNKRMESKEQRDMLASALIHSDKDDMRLFAQMLTDQANKHTSVAALMSRTGISLNSLSNEFKVLKNSEGLIRLFNHLPKLMEQAAVEATSETVTCIDCGGEGKIPAQGRRKEQKCRTCRGTGREHIPGCIERLKLVFETAGLIGKQRQGSLVNVNIGDMTGDESAESLYSSLGPIIEGKP